MAKGIIVVDIPKGYGDCKKCEYSSYTSSGIGCTIRNSILLGSNGKSKPDWCPISPMPEKAYVREYDRCKSVYDLSDRSRCIGWNACIDAIGGSEDEM